MYFWIKMDILSKHVSVKQTESVITTNFKFNGTFKKYQQINRQGHLVLGLESRQMPYGECLMKIN